MCGIAGCIDFAGVSPKADAELVRTLTARLRHRGPDDDGYYADERGRVHLGMRRLAIVDLDTGAQPQANEDGSVVVVFNGEIYNHLELRAFLAGRGHRFTSDHSDTEVIVHAYEEWGDSFLLRLIGMFAIALWDRRLERVLLVRDPIGKKPLYWRAEGARLQFASESSALARVLGLDGLDPQAVADVVRWGYVADGRSIWAGVHALAPGMLVAADRQGLQQRVYWEPPQTRLHDSFEQATETVDQLLRGAVACRLRADVPVGLFLSGGVDSSLIAALALDGVVGGLNTFSVVFRGDREDEGRWSSLVASRLGTNHEVLSGDEMDEQLLRRAILALDEPLADAAAIPTVVLAELAGRRMKVVLSGEGADELFLGYDEYVWLQRVESAARVLARAPLRLSSGDRARRLPYFLSAATRGTLRAAFAERMSPAELHRLGLTSEGADAPVTNGASEAARADLRRFLPYDLLMKVDKATMASGLEARAPYLDRRLVEYVVRLPAPVVLGSRLRPRTKALLRAVAERYLPPEISDRPKHAFLTPTDAWITAAGRAADAAAASLARVGVRMSAAALRGDSENGLGVTLGRRQRWTLFTLGLWLDEYPQAKIRAG